MHLPRKTPLALALAGLLLAACGRESPPAADAPPTGRVLAAAPAEADAGPGPDAPMPAAAGWPASSAPPPDAGTPMTTAWPAPAGGPAPAAAGGPQRVPIMDANGFEKPLPALWVDIPAGWQPQGQVVWDTNAPCGATPSYRWQAASPDGRQVLAIHSAEAWTWDNLGFPAMQGGCPRVQITSTREFLQAWVQKYRPGARVLDYRDRADLIRTPPPAAGGGIQHRKEAGELLIAWRDAGGEVRESVAAVVMFSLTTMPGVMPGEVRQFLSAMAPMPVTLRAPAGALDMDLLTRFAHSGQVDPQWQARMDQHNQQIARQGLEGQARRGAIAADTRRQVADMQMQGWQDTQDTNDRMHRRTVDAINNHQRYTDPATGGQVVLDNRYDHAWRSTDGQYLQTNDPNFDPSRDLGVDAQPMERDDQ